MSFSSCTKNSMKSKTRHGYMNMNYDTLAYFGLM
jgi:hypothetical protein